MLFNIKVKIIALPNLITLILTSPLLRMTICKVISLAATVTKIRRWQRKAEKMKTSNNNTMRTTNTWVSKKNVSGSHHILCENRQPVKKCQSIDYEYS